MIKNSSLQTPTQVLGPFYPGDAHFQSVYDLTAVPGSPARAVGTIAYIFGKVMDNRCQAVPGADIEIWQACASGKYNSEHDLNPARLDLNFRYWGGARTDADGRYFFKTIVPGPYPADPSINWVRPPHIHVKVSHSGFRELVTQLYFKGNPLNEKDLILEKIPRTEWERVVVDFQPSGRGFEAGSILGNFEIFLQRDSDRENVQPSASREYTDAQAE